MIAVLELRIGVETEAAALASQRRLAVHLKAMRVALDAFARAVERGGDAVAADFLFHSEIARTTRNEHFTNFIATLGAAINPPKRLGTAGAPDDAGRDYLRKANAEHESIFNAISEQDAEAARAAMRNCSS